MWNGRSKKKIKMEWAKKYSSEGKNLKNVSQTIFQN